MSDVFMFIVQTSDYLHIMSEFSKSGKIYRKKKLLVTYLSIVWDLETIKLHPFSTIAEWGNTYLNIEFIQQFIIVAATSPEIWQFFLFQEFWNTVYGCSIFSDQICVFIQVIYFFDVHKNSWMNLFCQQKKEMMDPKWACVLTNSW